MKRQLITHSIVNRGKEHTQGFVLPRVFPQYRFDNDGVVGEKNEEREHCSKELEGGKENCMPRAEAKAGREKCARRMYVTYICIRYRESRLSVSYLYLRSVETYCLSSIRVDRKISKRSSIQVNSMLERSTLRNVHSNQQPHCV